jgi:hypothetical protein
LTAAAAIGAASQAEAALYYWDDEPGFSRPSPPLSQRRPKARLRQGKKIEAPQKEASKPQGPLIIAISIERQNLKIYDANGFYAESPVSTGMRGHSTPMGVFSIIQKHKFHHSNIYSGAPMPYMQRITWSGVAMHAGVLPGYPASHGCIRMPMAFAVKMWGWTRMGARVVITPGEMTPAKFSHPLLVAQKVVPQPIATDAPKTDTPPNAKSDKGADAGPTVKPTTSEASLELRSTVGHTDAAKPERTHTADAGAVPATSAPVTMTDAAPSGGGASLRRETVSDRAGNASNAETKSEAAPAATERTETTASDADSKKPDEAQAVAPTRGEAVKIETKVDGVKAEAPKTAEKPDESITAATDVRPGTPTQNTPEQKDQARPPDIEKPAVSKPEPPKRAGQIAVFVSRKDAKLYVRQNFAPLFETPITIAPSERPLGTHVFTAQVDKDDANVLHWSVVSLPTPARYAERRDEDGPTSRRRKVVGAAEIKTVPVPNSAAEALDRLTIPADAMARVNEALSTGSSIIVSDQGINQGETGEGTDFIVSLR